MCKSQYVHLHNHTDASADGLHTVDSRVEYAAKQGFSHLAITDHGTMANYVGFSTACHDYGIAPIYGLEPYFMLDGSRYHITLLSTSEVGYNNLVGLNNASHKNIIKGYPCMSFEMFDEHNLGDIVALTGCPASVTYSEDRFQALSYIDTLKSLFERVYLEVMFVDDGRFYDKLEEVIKLTNLPHVITNDVHYNTEDESVLHPVITQCRKGYDYDSAGLHLASGKDMQEIALQYKDKDFVEQGLNNAFEIAESVLPFNMFSDPYLPEVPNADNDLYEIATTKLKEVYGNSKEARDRFDYEFNFLRSKGFVEYFYIVYDLVQFANKNNIPVGYGRGSAAGCIVSYLLGITAIDPVKYDLPFERFLNPARKDFPDIDMDFSSKGKQKIVDYAFERWGAIPIATYSRYSHASLCSDIGRVLNLPKKEIDAVKANGIDITSEAFERFSKMDNRIEPFYKAALGQQRHKGKHAGGVVIPSVDRKIPVEKTGPKKLLTVAFTEGLEKQLSKVGLIKFDVLAVSALDQLARMYELCKKLPPTDPDTDLAPLSVFRNGHTTGLFQWGSDAVTEMTQNIQPEVFEDLININALNRPGALDAGTAQNFHNYKKSPRLVESRIDEVLKQTYGVIVFQEQVMQIYALVTGGDLKDGDIARRILSPKSVKVLDDPKWQKSLTDTKDKFFTKGLENGYSKSVLTMVWSELETHSRYSFNRAHSASYAMYAYNMAWYKYYHPEAFYIAMMELDVTNKQSYLLDLFRQSNYVVRKPHINISEFDKHVVVGNELFLPLSDVDGISTKCGNEITKARSEHGKFSSWSEVLKNVPKRYLNIKVRSHLFSLGGFSGLKADVDIKKFVDISKIPDTELDAELKMLGYLIISDKNKGIFDKVSKNQFVGVVTGHVDKKSKYGQFRRFFLSPNGSFWMRNNYDMIKKGDLLRVKVSDYGKAIKVERIKLK